MRGAERESMMEVGNRKEAGGTEEEEGERREKGGRENGTHTP